MTSSPTSLHPIISPLETNAPTSTTSPQEDNNGNITQLFASSVTPTISGSQPTTSPTLSETSFVQETFTQSYYGEPDLMSDEQIIAFQVVITLLTAEYAPYFEPLAKTNCIVVDQHLTDFSDKNEAVVAEEDGGMSRNRLLRSIWKTYGNNPHFETRQLLGTDLRVTFTMNWSSVHVLLDPDTYVNNFIDYMNSVEGKNKTLTFLNELSILTKEVGNLTVYRMAQMTPPSPSTAIPTSSTLMPSSMPMTSDLGWNIVANPPSSSTPPSSKISILPLFLALIAVLVVGGSFGVCYHMVHKKQLTRRSAAAAAVNNTDEEFQGGTPSLQMKSSSAIMIGDDNNMASPEFIKFDPNSNKNDIDGDVLSDQSSIFTTPTTDEQPQQPQSQQQQHEQLRATHHNHKISEDSILVNLQHDEKEFPRDELEEYYRNDSFEKMRISIIGRVFSCENMISQSITSALLMEEDDAMKDIDGIIGDVRNCGRRKNVLVIEVNILCETHNWLKRREVMKDTKDSQTLNLNERQTFLLNIMQKMTICVLYSILSPHQSARIVHECASMLNLPLRVPLSDTTLIVSGLRKNVKTLDVQNAFRKFGQVMDVAVESNSRGFALVRYTSSKYAQKALDKFRTGEIVVQDVAVMVRKLAGNRTSSLSVRGSTGVRKDREPKVHRSSSSGKIMNKASSSSNNRPVGGGGTRGGGDNNSIPFPLSLLKKKSSGGGGVSIGSRRSIDGICSSHIHHNNNFHRRIISTPSAPPPSLPRKNHQRAASDGHHRNTILTDSTAASGQNLQLGQQQQQQRKRIHSEDLTEMSTLAE